MRYPERNSRREQILKAFMAGPMTIYQGTEIHGGFPSRTYPNGINQARMIAMYADLIERGCLVREGILYRLSLAAKTRLEQAAAAPEVRSIVPARIRNFLDKPLFQGYSPFSPWRLAL